MANANLSKLPYIICISTPFQKRSASESSTCISLANPGGSILTSIEGLCWGKLIVNLVLSMKNKVLQIVKTDCFYNTCKQHGCIHSHCFRLKTAFPYRCECFVHQLKSQMYSNSGNHSNSINEGQYHRNLLSQLTALKPEFIFQIYKITNNVFKSFVTKCSEYV